jgi:isopentenyl phosphate kinase
VTTTISSVIQITTSTPASQTTETTTPSTTQPQEIVSPDGKLKILDHKLSKQLVSTQFIKWIQGDVQNISDSTVVCVISVDFIIKNGSTAETQEIKFNIDPGATKKFSVYSGGVIGQIAYIGWDCDDYLVSVRTAS